MLRHVLMFMIHRPWGAAPPCCAAAGRARRLVILGLLLLLSLLPLAARPDAPEPGAVAEALFLCDPLPPSGRDLGLSVATQPGDEAGMELLPRLQLALGVGDRLGLTADVGLDAAGGALHSPGASLKALLRDPAGGRLGVAASLDLLGSRALDGTEAALGLGVLQPLGRLTLRASASVATTVARWGPHLHAGGSAAFAVGSRWRFLCEVIAEAADGRVAWAAGPTVKVALGSTSALAAGALVDLQGPSRPPAFVVQLTQGL